MQSKNILLCVSLVLVLSLGVLAHGIEQKAFQADNQLPVIAPGFVIQPASFLEFKQKLTVTEIEEAVFDLVNEERSERRLAEVAFDRELASVARAYSRKMARKSFFSHYDEEGNTVQDRVSHIKDWRGVGENLFYCEGYDDPASVAVEGWLRSDSHRKNMLQKDWKTSGVGAAIARDGRVFVTQIFMRK
jgi:uncharacterized protein YkwD